MEKRLQGNYPLRRRHMGLAGGIIIVSQIITQYFSSSHSTKNIYEEVRQIRSDQEKFFVKKEELESVSHKLDRLRKDLSEMDDRIKFIKRYVSSDSKSKPINLSRFVMEDKTDGSFK
jgi:hypothetical protein